MIELKYKLDKSEIIIWSLIFGGTIMILVTSLLLCDLVKIIYCASLLLLVFAFFSFYCWTNKYRCKKFNLLCKEFECCRENVEYEELFIKVKQKKYKTKPLKQSMEVKIDVPLYKVKAFSIRTIDVFIIFFAINEFIFFKKYIKPIVFKKTEAILFKSNKDITLIEKDLKIEVFEKEISICLKDKVDSLEQIIIPVGSYSLEFFNHFNYV